MREYDIVINHGLYFDGSGKTPASIKHLGLKNGRVVAVCERPFDDDSADRVIDAQGLWVMPGFIDTHTHYDAELLISPSLSESLRHGVTTAMVGSCSISMVCCEAEDASDIFTRVETVPREKVLPIVQHNKVWSTPKQWVEYVQQLPLGPNVISMLGHSDLRVAVMGLLRATDHEVEPTENELQQMEKILRESLDAGFLGLSTMRLTWDKLDGDRAWSKSLPSTYAKWREISRLLRIVRDSGRIHQGAPNAGTPLQIFQYIGESLGLLRKRLKTTLISQMDLKGSRYLRFLTNLASLTANALRGDFRWQVLPTPFTIYADGIDIVFFEEFGAGEMALDLKDQVERNALLKDEEYRRTFRKFYGEKLSPRVWQRDFGDAIVLACPDQHLVGKNFAEIAADRGIHVVDLFLDLVVEYGNRLRWYTTVANHRPRVLEKLVKNKRSLITFSDAGAHIRNMAFYNLPLRLLQMVNDSQTVKTPIMSMEEAVYRMTGDQADWFGIDAGRICVGDRADIVILDPKGFAQDLEEVSWAEMENFEIQRLVNRNPGLVKHVLVNGKPVLEEEILIDDVGKQSGYGQFIPANNKAG
jgi:N-acyl-D-aspartate/D-glutamate deacylase